MSMETKMAGSVDNVLSMITSLMANGELIDSAIVHDVTVINVAGVVRCNTSFIW